MARVVKKPEERKEELMDVAITLFMEKGYENTSIKDIYGKVNGSFGMFYHHFKSKEEIFEAAMDRYTDIFVEKIATILLDKDIPFARRYQLILTHWLSLINGRDKVRSSQFDEAVFRALSGKMLSGAIEPVKLYIEEGIKNGQMKSDRSHDTAIILVYGIYGLIIEEWKQLNNNKNAPSVFVRASEFVAKLLDTDKATFVFR